MWLAIGSKEIPNIATNWFVCAVVLGLTQYPVMPWVLSQYDGDAIDPVSYTHLTLPTILLV